MAILSWQVANPARTKSKNKHNRKKAVDAFLAKYQTLFDMKEDAIDLRAMSKNFDHEIIPVEDIHQAILTMIGPTYAPPVYNIDPSGGNYLGYGDKNPLIYFDYIDWNQLYLWSIFNRDVAPNHVEKIYNDFEPTSVIVPCLIKITLETGRTIFCIWDGHHTIQVCRLKGWNKFPAWIIDSDQIPLEEIENAGFSDTDADRIAYACLIAGKNMRRINGLNKRELSPYCDFWIAYDTKDKEFIKMYNILTKNGCVVKRHHDFIAGAFTQIKSGIECYKLADQNGILGKYWDRALAVHRKYWPGSPLILEIFRPLSYLYYEAELEGFNLTADFDNELALMLKNKWGDAESIQDEIKKSYWTAVNSNKLVGDQPRHDKFRVLAGIINFYKQNGGKSLLPAPACQWKV